MERAYRVAPGIGTTHPWRPERWSGILQSYSMRNGTWREEWYCSHKHRSKKAALKCAQREQVRDPRWLTAECRRALAGERRPRRAGEL